MLAVCQSSLETLCGMEAGRLTSGLRLEGTGNALPRDSFRDANLPEAEICARRVSPPSYLATPSAPFSKRPSDLHITRICMAGTHP